MSGDAEKTNGNGRVVMLKGWHFIIGLVLNLIVAAISFTAGYSTLKAQAEETQRRVSVLEQKQLTYQEWKDGQDAIDKRLAGIERRLDNLR